MKNIAGKIVSLMMAGIITFIASGCSMFVSSTQRINVTCMPPDAVLMINGERHTSPAQVRVKRDENVSIQCYKEGYMPYQRTIGYHLSTTGTLDVIGIFIFLLPGLGLFCAGSDSLEETDINVDLYQK